MIMNKKEEKNVRKKEAMKLYIGLPSHTCKT